MQKREENKLKQTKHRKTKKINTLQKINYCKFFRYKIIFKVYAKSRVVR